MIVREAWADDFANIEPREEGVQMEHAGIPQLCSVSVAVAVLDQGRTMALVGVVRNTGFMWAYIDKAARPRHIVAARHWLVKHPAIPARAWMMVNERLPLSMGLARAVGAKDSGKRIEFHGETFAIMEVTHDWD